MNQPRLNWYLILHIHCDEADKLDLTAIANEFVSRNPSRQRIFREFFLMCVIVIVIQHVIIHKTIASECTSEHPKLPEGACSQTP